MSSAIEDFGQKRFIIGDLNQSFCQYIARLSEAKGYRTGTELLSGEFKEPKNLIGDIIPEVGIWFLVGGSDVGKSTFLTQMGLSVASGREFIGEEVKPKYGRVIYVSTEDDEESVSYRLKRMNRELEICPEEVEGFTLITDFEDITARLMEESEDAPADLIIIDAFGDVFNGKDLNSNNQVRQFLQPFGQMANKYKCSVCFMHHTAKRTEDLAPSKNNSIGSQGIEAKARLVMELRNDRNNSTLKHLCIVKGNRLGADFKDKSFILSFSDNLVFSNTGDRKAFGDLVKADGKGKNEKITVETFSEQKHSEALKQIFRKKQEFSQTEFTGMLSTLLGISDRTSRKIMAEYWAKDWIERDESNPRKIIIRRGVSAPGSVELDSEDDEDWD